MVSFQKGQRKRKREERVVRGRWGAYRLYEYALLILRRCVVDFELSWRGGRDLEEN